MPKCSDSQKRRLFIQLHRACIVEVDISKQEPFHPKLIETWYCRVETLSATDLMDSPAVIRNFTSKSQSDKCSMIESARVEVGALFSNSVDQHLEC